MSTALDIKAERERCKLSQRDLADAVDIPRDRIAKWEQGKGTPKVEDFEKLVKFFQGKTNSKHTDDQLREPKQEYAQYIPPALTDVDYKEWLQKRVTQGNMLGYVDSVELRLISDFAARLVIEGHYDGNREGHVDILLDYSDIYLRKKAARAGIAR